MKQNTVQNGILSAYDELWPKFYTGIRAMEIHRWRKENKFFF